MYALRSFPLVVVPLYLTRSRAETSQLHPPRIRAIIGVALEVTISMRITVSNNDEIPLHEIDMRLAYLPCYLPSHKQL